MNPISYSIIFFRSITLVKSRTLLWVSAFTLITALFAKAQTLEKEQKISALPQIYLKKGVTLHIISPEALEFVDLSSPRLVGDLPAENLARIKIDELFEKEFPVDSTGLSSESNKSYTTHQEETPLGIITLVGKSFLAQYHAVSAKEGSHEIQTNFYILPEHMQPLEMTSLPLSSKELKEISASILSQGKKSPQRKTSAYGLSLGIGGVYMRDEYLFLDLLIKNSTQLSIEFSGLEFSVEDKKLFKSTNQQSVPLIPLYKHQKSEGFRKSYRNVYVLEKLSFPSSKVLVVRFVEEGILGRTIELKLPYSLLLKADPI